MNEVEEIFSEIPIKADEYQIKCICGNIINNPFDHDADDADMNNTFFGTMHIEEELTCEVCESVLQLDYQYAIVLEVEKIEAFVVTGPKGIDDRLISDNYFNKVVDLPDGIYKTLTGSVWIEGKEITAIFSHHDKNQLELQLY